MKFNIGDKVLVNPNKYFEYFSWAFTTKESCNSFYENVINIYEYFIILSCTPYAVFCQGIYKCKYSKAFYLRSDKYVWPKEVLDSYFQNIINLSDYEF